MTFSQRGFTLIETLVAVSLFSVLLVMTIGSLTILIDANRKARSEKAVINNLNAALEIVSRSMREGSGYVCTPNPTCTGANSGIQFVTKSGTRVAYRLAGDAIERSVDGGATFTAVTGPDVSISSLSFESIGAALDVPKFQITVKAQTLGDAATGAEFNLQTTVAQRYSFQAPITQSKPECGNADCEWDENDGSCPLDCRQETSVRIECGNGQCEWGEDARSCPNDCVITETSSPAGGDVMLLLDVSGSIAQKEMTVLNQSVNFLVDKVFARSNQTRMGIVEFSHWARLISHLTSNKTQLENRFNNSADPKGAGSTNTAVGLRMVRNEYRGLEEIKVAWDGELLTPNGTVNDTRPFGSANRPDKTYPNHVILITDGAVNGYLAHTGVRVNGKQLRPGDWVNRICPPGRNGELTADQAEELPGRPCIRGTVPAMNSMAREAAELKKIATLHVIAIGIAPGNCDGIRCNEFLKNRIASSPATYYELPAFDQAALNQIISRMIDATGGFTERNIDCSGCGAGGTCDPQCVEGEEETQIISIDCSQCRSGGACPPACVVPPIKATTSRPIDIEEF